MTAAAQSRLKRAFDVTVAAVGLVATAPVMAGCAVAIRATMGSPVLFRQPRGGYRGSTFDIVKFRTMSLPRPGESELLTDGIRLTPVGKFLRRLSLDELPQLWNVLRGDMSIVGPRPLIARYLTRYSREQARRHEVVPGVTGWAQVHGRNALTWEQRFVLDVWYVDHWSFWLDMQILALTVHRVLTGRDTASSGHATMYEFMGTPPRTNGAAASAGVS
jgi:sugar transferase EpsL